MNKILIAGPCVGEASVQWVVDQAGAIAGQVAVANAGAATWYEWIFKCSFDKANRTSGRAYRGLGLDATLDALQQVKSIFGCRATTDIHEAWQASEVCPVVDVIQIPAMLMRQTDLIWAASRMASVNIKISTTANADVIEAAVDKANGVGDVMLTYRGTSYGDRLVFEPERMLDVPVHHRYGTAGLPCLLDITHIARDEERDPAAAWADMTWLAATCGAALGVGGFFLECHPNPPAAESDSNTQIRIDSLADLLGGLPW
jgi:2-dehydro-3-deoxyphosphooctonate aldolase (KDO 8-P synthase)